MLGAGGAEDCQDQEHGLWGLTAEFVADQAVVAPDLVLRFPICKMGMMMMMLRVATSLGYSREETESFLVPGTESIFNK